MILKSIDELNGGEVLAEPIILENTTIPIGTVIKTEYIPLLKSMDVLTVTIENHEETSDSIIEESRFVDYVERTRKIMENHIYQSNHSLRKFEVIANEIIKEVEELPEDKEIHVTERNADLFEHTIMVTLFSVLIGKRLKLDRKRLYHIALGALLHDIGIRYITVTCESVDMKEMDAVKVFELKKHTILGYSALDGESWIPDISRKMILSHHERIDGSGYPMRQKNQEIECRIIQVCDAFDCALSAMECKRMSLNETVDMLKETAGKGLDEGVVKELLDIMNIMC